MNLFVACSCTRYVFKFNIYISVAAMLSLHFFN